MKLNTEHLEKNLQKVSESFSEVSKSLERVARETITQQKVKHKRFFIKLKGLIDTLNKVALNRLNFDTNNYRKYHKIPMKRRRWLKE